MKSPAMAFNRPAFTPKSRPRAVALGRRVSSLGASQRLLPGLGIGLGCMMLLAGAIDPSLPRMARVQVADVAAPALEILSRPAHALNQTIARYDSWQAMAAENERLRAENEPLRGWHAEATRLGHENADLRQLVAARPQAAQHYVSAPVIGDASGGYAKSIIVAAGADQGVTSGQAVRTGSGVIGKVTEAGQQSARILLLTDMNARLPVLLERTREHAMLVGDNTATPVLRYLDHEAVPKLGDRLVTSGTGGLMPKGLPVGVVTGIDDGLVRVTLSADAASLNMVSIIDYGLGTSTADLR